jgi:hypothetical protein
MTNKLKEKDKGYKRKLNKHKPEKQQKKLPMVKKLIDK